MVDSTLSILCFGRVSDLIGSSRIDMPLVNDTDELQQWLNKQYPALRQATYVIAVDQEIIRKNTLLTVQQEIALLPPFSGG
ncbi:MoaD/ThiS family protein [Parapedobacter sp. DT-150]|uniref:MoaD/ThiS family protein n=1 Tax=Parapedobacter sp. DT-150 TaxID=3396162 RepID=UPI003F1BCB3A